MLVTIGSVYSVHTKIPPTDLPVRLTNMGCWPTVYNADSSPSDNADYVSVVYFKGERSSITDVIDLLRPYGCTSGRWITDFFEVL